MRTSIIVQNLKCGGCAKTITNKLLQEKGVFKVDVDVEASKISFDHDEHEDALQIKNTLKSLGYPSIEDTNSLMDKTKSFISCATGKLS
ncbi:heavy-metal-associated domain-containing protein [Flagellimonas sp. HMM57]|uniref:heavy-metal-associated domain-containing protein n=1 Tax=unclassified Flagellimonas TaxID=2644544 RepID=UPI0013D5DD8D|nr:MULTISPECIES: heavy metal-associated domain-containing protein [unclassified Flagellimonas]UII76484.1 heavy-metal-associated domain-containing protein [Flagellimonas sp. HMM57]